MQRKYNLAYSVFALGLMTLMIGVDAQAQIAFVSDRDGHSWEIYVMDADGGNPRRLTNSPEDEWDPSWSPDGKRIVFSSQKGDNEWETDIYVMDADGGNPRKLTKNPGVDNYPEWSPDGKRIVFISSRGNNNWWETDIHVMDPNGRNHQNLTNHPAGGDLTPSWSPDGERIAFAPNRVRSFDIYVMDADGQNRQNLTNVMFGNDSAPAWFNPNLAIAPAAVAPTGKKLTMWGWFKRIGR